MGLFHETTLFGLYDNWRLSHRLNSGANLLVKVEIAASLNVNSLSLGATNNSASASITTVSLFTGLSDISEKA